jgi:hypothetical protein
MTTIPQLAAMLKQMTPQDQLVFQGWVLWRMQAHDPSRYCMVGLPMGVAWEGLSAADQERVVAAFAAYEVERREGW